MHDIPDDLAELASHLLAGTPLTLHDAIGIASGERPGDPTDPVHQALCAGWAGTDPTQEDHR